MTEAAITTENRQGMRKIGTAGRESALYHVQVVDPEDRPVPPGTAGEIVGRPKRPHIMIDNYFDMPEATVKAFRNLWFRTGDRGRLDEDGYLTFIDRMKDCVRRRGENISSYEVEAVINTCDAVLESAVIGVPSELGEEGSWPWWCSSLITSSPRQSCSTSACPAWPTSLCPGSCAGVKTCPRPV